MNKLIVDIQSFSYKNGIPQDLSGNGGGFVFDCRGIYNPGRIDVYKTQSGLDKDVIQFLETQTEMNAFLKHIYKIIDITLDNYLKRKFEHLQISFGCTGGQHRSVYSAEQLANYLSQKYPEIVLKLSHSNQENWVR